MNKRELRRARKTAKTYEAMTTLGGGAGGPGARAEAEARAESEKAAAVAAAERAAVAQQQQVVAASTAMVGKKVQGGLAGMPPPRRGSRSYGGRLKSLSGSLNYIRHVLPPFRPT